MSDPRRDHGPEPSPDGLPPTVPPGTAAGRHAPPASATAADIPPFTGSSSASRAESPTDSSTVAQPGPHAQRESPVPPPPDSGWMGDLHGLAQAARGMVQSRALLLMLELQRARHGFVSLMVLLVVAAIAGATAWWALWAGLIALAVHMGLALPWACAGVLVINLLLLLWVAAAMKALAPMMSLPASRRQFHWLFNDPRDQEDPSTDGRTTAPNA
ncbi:hypothetical protein OU995_21780 [Roseateles sp. SL47]|uniref:hypothetical protein n=1 Tax=Roseateles sp. SL47 TaxID=2995138 RepID=UPI00226EFA15|nr:hypothetical protein [Roseateles sp. SL47]WAC72166.1 hypothetical protein OU995_21780 [Roseateles sp. SL47]